MAIAAALGAGCSAASDGPSATGGSGGSGGSGAGNPGPGRATVTTSTEATGPTQASTSSGASCSGASECGAGEVCDGASKACVHAPGCAAHADCPVESVCKDDRCVANEPSGPCASDTNCLAGETCANGVCGCGGELYVPEVVLPNVLITLDRSGSMDFPAVEGGPTSRWDDAKAAVSKLLQLYPNSVRWGLKLWPGQNDTCKGDGSGPSCDSGKVFVDVGPNTAASINSIMSTAGRCQLGTPIGGALEPLTSYPPLEDATRPNYILLITDGKENCSGDGLAAVKALRAENPEIKTYVIGFGKDVNGPGLNEIAIAGGSKTYYQANSEAQLSAAFAAIAGTVISCAYELSSIPPDPDKLFVYFDGVPVAKDATHAAGWDYDSMTHQMTFYGSTCLSLQQGLVDDLVISYGCANAPSVTSGGGTSCSDEKGSCSNANDCCGGLDCIQGICTQPVPK